MLPFLREQPGDPGRGLDPADEQLEALVPARDGRDRDREPAIAVRGRVEGIAVHIGARVGALAVGVGLSVLAGIGGRLAAFDVGVGTPGRVDQQNVVALGLGRHLRGFGDHEAHARALAVVLGGQGAGHSPTASPSPAVHLLVTPFGYFPVP